jgi:hypothetical protein
MSTFSSPVLEVLTKLPSGSSTCEAEQFFYMASLLRTACVSETIYASEQADIEPGFIYYVCRQGLLGRASISMPGSM